MQILPLCYLHLVAASRSYRLVPKMAMVQGSTCLANVGEGAFSGLSESIPRVLAPLAIQVTFRPFRSLRQELVHPMDPVPANYRKGVVYSIPCADAPAPTLVKQVDPWTIAFKNTAGLGRTET